MSPIPAIQCIPAAPSIWIEVAKGIPAALITLLIGTVAAWVAYHQYRVSRAKLNLDLFTRRLSIFDETWAFLSAGVQGQYQVHATLFTNRVPEASFLFGDEVAAYMKLASANMMELAMMTEKSRARNNVLSPEDIDKHLELSKWFADEASHGAKARFGKYLSFAEWH